MVRPGSPADAAPLHQEIALLKEQVRLYQKELNAAREREGRLLGLIERRLLPPPTEPAKPKAVRKPPPAKAAKAPRKAAHKAKPEAAQKPVKKPIKMATKTAKVERKPATHGQTVG